MIIGILLRNFKAYEGLYFARVSNEELDKLSIFIGNNGVGKSSILEALDCFYNKKKWNTNKNGKLDEAFIAPVILTEKSSSSSSTNKILDFAGSYFWNIAEDEILNAKRKIPAISSFLKFRDELKKKSLDQTHNLIVCGLKYGDPETPYFSTFDHDFKAKCLNNNISTTLIRYLGDITRNKYNFIYFPVESSVKDILDLEHFEMQSMMELDLSIEIDRILKERKIEYTDDETGKKKSIGIVELITIQLDEFLTSINNTVREINPEYAYKRDGRARNVKASDIRQNIIQAYFSTRKLTKGKKSISDLSSGEKRMALIDVAYAFLSKRKKLSKEVIIAIDEPEASMHTSMSFAQFRRIAEMATAFNKQVLITTHWYGLLPTCQTGAVHHIELLDKINIRSFNLSSLYEERRHFPQDVSLKSFFDLSSSIVSQMRSEVSNWIICEGSDDARYFKFFLSDNIPSLNVLPAGGIGNVVKLFKHLYGPLSEKTEAKLLNGKILCLIDTDPERIHLDTPSSCQNLAIRRIQRSNGSVTLADPNNGGLYSPTAIEDCLAAQPFITSMFDILKAKDQQTHQFIRENYKPGPSAGFVDINQGFKAIKPKTQEGHEKLDDICLTVTDNKMKFAICNKYVKQPRHSMIWMKAIIDYFDS